MNNGMFMLLAFVIGSLIPLQLVFNSQLGTITRSPYSAGLVVMLVGLVAMGLLLLCTQTPLPTPKSLASAPFTAYLGGVIAALYIVAVILVSPHLGVGLTTALILCGQLAMALVLDHLGAFGNPQISLNPVRILGAIMMVAGILAIKNS